MSLIRYTTQIVTSYLSRQEMPVHEISPFMREIHQALASLSEPEGTALPSDSTVSVDHQENPTSELSTQAPQKKSENSHKTITPAVSIEDAVRSNAVVCLVCGRTMKTLRMHLTRSHNLTVESYRNRFGLDPDFPLVSPDYSAKRRQLAIDAGLGEKTKKK
ncbi:MAG: MucR family transcriptional regulator [Magnetococcales bacterium]|nr:MucR family transcriptional regulator [Magnetococcales bacterium]